MLMKVSHESPISLLSMSRSYNDFDYCLIHLCESHPAYYNFFDVSRRVYNREILLDNSIFELGHAFDPVKYIDWALKIQANMIIVPDVLENSQATRDSWTAFTKMDRYAEIPGRKIGAVQGNTWHDILECYKFMSDNADMIAISFDFSYYNITGEGNTKLERMCSGRQRLINQLIDKGVWNWNKPTHLLGCSLAREFRHYVDNNIHNIVSCDTSNPVVAGIKGLRYDCDFGLSTKPSIKLADLIDTSLDDEQIELIKYNVDQFKKIIRR